MTTEKILRDSLPNELTEKMLAHKAATSEPCPTCGVGRGRTCRDAKGALTATHPGR